MLALLALALGAPGAAGFVLQLASRCSLATNGSLVAPEAQLALGSVPVVCADFGAPEGPRAVTCPGGGPLSRLGDAWAAALNRDPRWGRSLRERREVCREVPQGAWPPRTAPPQLGITSWRSGPGLGLACHAWAFAPPALGLRWLRNGEPLGDPPGPPRALPVGDGSFRAELRLEVTAEVTLGDTWECLATHPALGEPLVVRWAPGPSAALSVRVAAAVLVLALGLVLCACGLRQYLRATPPAGYSPLPGDTFAGST